MVVDSSSLLRELLFWREFHGCASGKTGKGAPPYPLHAEKIELQVSIAFSRDATGKRLEPSAPLVSERRMAVEKLVEEGVMDDVRNLYRANGLEVQHCFKNILKRSLCSQPKGYP